MRKNLTTAFFVAAGLLLWLLSGLFFENSAQESHATLAQQGYSAQQSAQESIPSVRVRVLTAESRTQFLVLRGKTQSKRMVEIKAEVTGKVVRRPVERGQQVQRGDVLCQLAIDDREVSIVEANASLADAQIEYDGSLKLKEQGLQSQTAIARARTRLEAAKASLHRHNLNLQRTLIVAPFAGIVEELQMNLGDYATPGSSCATLIALDPMLISANVTESEVENIEPGDRVFGRTVSGDDINGELTFIGKQSDPITRTYPLEVTVENKDYAIRSGLTATVRIALGDRPAHRISPALFTLNDLGDLGVHTIGKNETVEFHPVTVVEDSTQGVWVSGLPETVHLITVGQEFVLAGQRIQPVYPKKPLAVSVQP